MSQTNPNQEIEPTTTSPSTSNLVQESTTKTETSNPTETTPILSTPNRNGNGNDDDDDSDSESEDEGVIIRWRDPIKKPLNYSRIYRFMRPYALPATDRLWLISLANILVIVAIRAINLVPPYALKLAVDSIAINYRNPPFRELIIYLIAVMLRSLFSSANHVLQTILRRKAKKQFAVDSFTRMVHQDMGFHTKQKGGSRFRIMWRGAEAVAMLMQEILFNVIPTLLECIFIIAMFGRIGTPLIALVIIVSVILYWGVTILRSEVNVNQERRSNALGDELAHKEMDTFNNIETVKTFGTVDAEIYEYRRLQEEACGMRISFERTNEFYSLLTTFVQNASTAAALALAAVGTSNGYLTIGDFVLINSYIAQLYRPLLDLSRAYARITESAANVEKVIKMLKKDPVIVDEADAKDITDVKGSISFDDVSFKYKTKKSEKTTLKNISFQVPAGGVLGIVGHSGSGKSTIIKLATRLYDATEGVVKIDGVNIKKYKIKDYRSLFGVVSQYTSLFHTTIKNNVQYGNSDTNRTDGTDDNDDETWEAIRAAALDTYCEKLSDGLETKVGDSGSELAGGERQRIGVARAIIRKPQFLILDEASSALDSKTEKEMRDNLKAICKGRTSLVVAHRLSTIMDSDEIIVLNEGEIIERGTHEQLLEKKGEYDEMWRTQCGLKDESHRR